MSLSAPDRATIERWSGPIVDDTAVLAQLDRLGAPEVVAFERLLALRAEMLSTVAKRSVGDERFDHGPNMRWVNSQLDRLGAYIASSDDIVLNPEAEGLVDAEAVAQDKTRIVTLATLNPRRGG